MKKSLRNRSNSDPATISLQSDQEMPQIVTQTAIPNRNCYFTLASSSSDDYEEETMNERTPLIRPRIRSPLIQE